MRWKTTPTDQRFRTYIADGIKNGFRVGYNYEEVNQLCSSPANMASAMQHPEVIREYLAKECSEGRVLGPLDPTQFPLCPHEPLWGNSERVDRKMETHSRPVFPGGHQ